LTKKRIKELADFFYSSDSSEDVPVRVSLIRGMYSGFDLNKQSFIKFMGILASSKDLKSDLLKFLEEMKEEEMEEAKFIKIG